MGIKWTKGRTPENEIVLEGIEMFPENAEILAKPREPATELLDIREAEVWWPFFHGQSKNECLMVKWRREKTYQEHYLDIWYCLTHKVECCRCGMEWRYYQEEHYLKQYEHYPPRG